MAETIAVFNVVRNIFVLMIKITKKKSHPTDK